MIVKGVLVGPPGLWYPQALTLIDGLSITLWVGPAFSAAPQAISGLLAYSS
jgi:hypothetical protein